MILRLLRAGSLGTRSEAFSADPMDAITKNSKPADRWMKQIPSLDARDSNLARSSKAEFILPETAFEKYSFSDHQSATEVVVAMEWK